MTTKLGRRLAVLLGCGIAAVLVVLWMARDHGPPSAKADRYLLQAIAQIRAHHLNSSKLDWEKVTAGARRHIRGATEPSDTYDAVRWVLAEAGESHSFFLSPSEARSFGHGGFLGGPSLELPTAGRIGNVAIVRLPGLVTPPAEMEEAGAKYAKALRLGLTQLDRLPLCGWIVDMRGNGGGNMWPMLSGLGPLLGAPPYGYFVDRHGAVTPWLLLEGAEPFTIRQAHLPVAVLMDEGTNSSGEIVTLALVGRPGVKTFGTPSAGMTTGNLSLPMPDGAMLFVTSAFVRDRTGHEYRGAIEPDVHVDASSADERAVQWLQQRCKAGELQRSEG